MVTYNDKILVPNSAKDGLDTIHPETNTGNVYDFKNDGWLSETFEEVKSTLTTHLDDFVLHTPYAEAISTNGNDYTVALNNITQYIEGMSIAIKPNMTSVIGVYININGLGAVRAIQQNGVFVNGIMFKKDTIYTFRFNGGMFVMQSGNTLLTSDLNSTSTVEAATANAVKQVNDKFKLPASTPVTLLNSWEYNATTTTQPLSFFKDSFGVVNLEGAVQRTSGARSIITTLPVGYRPKRLTNIFAFISDDNSEQTVRFTVNTNGDLKQESGTIDPIRVIINGSFRTD